MSAKKVCVSLLLSAKQPQAKVVEVAAVKLICYDAEINYVYYKLHFYLSLLILSERTNLYKSRYIGSVVNYLLVKPDKLQSKKFGITIAAIYPSVFMNFCKSVDLIIINIKFFITVLPPK